MSSSLLTVIEYSLYTVATIVACFYNTEAQIALKYGWKVATELTKRWSMRINSARSDERRQLPSLIASNSSNSAVSVLSDMSNDNDEQKRIEGRQTSSTPRGSSHCRLISRNSIRASCLKKPSFASHSQHSDQSSYRLSQHSGRASCLKKQSSMCSNAKKPIRQVSDDALQVSFDDDCFSSNSDVGAASWASEDDFIVTSGNDSTDGGSSLPKAIVPVSIREHGVVAPIRPGKSEELSGDTTSPPRKPVRNNQSKEPKTSTRDYNSFAPKRASKKDAPKCCSRSIDTHVARSIGMRVRHKIQRHSSFDSGLAFRQNDERSSIAKKTEKHRQHLHSATSQIAVLAPPLDNSPQKSESANWSVQSVQESPCGSALDSSHLQINRIDEVESPPRLVTRRSSMQKSPPEYKFERRGSLSRSARIPSSSDFSAKTRRGSVTRCLSSDQIPTTRASATRRTLQRAASTLALETGDGPRMQLRRTASTRFPQGKDGAPRAPARSSSHGKRPGILRHTSSTKSSEHRTPSRNNSLSKRPGLVKNASSLNLGRPSKSAISSHDRQILQRVQSCRDLFS